MLTGERDTARIARFYLDRGASRMVVKNGAAGASSFTREERLDQPILPVLVVDTVGAGDGFAAGLISAALDGLGEREQLVRAAAVGALATTSPGDKDGLPTRDELAAFLDRRTVA